jgi:hypothetical protein
VCSVVAQRRGNLAAANKFAAANPERVAETKRRWAENNREKVRASNRRCVERNPEGDREAKRRHSIRKYGITLEDWWRLFDAQGRACGICRTTENNQTDRDWHVDHNHATGKVRGILCHGCNTGIGHLKDSPVVTRLATEYLEKPPFDLLHPPSHIM